MAHWFRQERVRPHHLILRGWSCQRWHRYGFVEGLHSYVKIEISPYHVCVGVMPSALVLEGSRERNVQPLFCQPLDQHLRRRAQKYPVRTLLIKEKTRATGKEDTRHTPCRERPPLPTGPFAFQAARSCCTAPRVRDRRKRNVLALCLL